MKIALIIPCYNFEKYVRSTVDKVLAWRQKQGPDCHVYFVDDGSTDQTAQILKQTLSTLSDRCHVLVHAVNRGKGAAVRTGFHAARQNNIEAVIFTDCDLHYGLEIISDRIIPELSSHDIVILDRSWSEEARYHSVLRTIASFIYNRLVSILTGVNYRDTQSGLKGFKVPACEPLFGALTLEGFAFDVELLSLASYYRMSVRQIPIQFESKHVPPVHTTIHLLLTPWKMVLALFKINMNWRNGRYQNKPLEERINRDVYCIRTSND